MYSSEQSHVSPHYLQSSFSFLQEKTIDFLDIRTFLPLKKFVSVQSIIDKLSQYSLKLPSKFGPSCNFFLFNFLKPNLPNQPEAIFQTSLKQKQNESSRYLFINVIFFDSKKGFFAEQTIFQINSSKVWKK